MNLLKKLWNAFLRLLGIQPAPKTYSPEQDEIKAKVKNVKVIDPHLEFTLYIEGNENYHFDGILNGSINMVGESEHPTLVVDAKAQGAPATVTIGFNDSDWGNDKNRTTMEYTVNLVLTNISSDGNMFEPISQSGTATVVHNQQ